MNSVSYTTGGKARTTKYTYDESGNRKTITYDGDTGVSEQYTYYKDNRVKTLINKKPDGTVISSFEYTYYGNGKLETKKDSKVKEQQHILIILEDNYILY